MFAEIIVSRVNLRVNPRSSANQIRAFATARIYHFMKHQLGTMDHHVINSHSQ
jgi:hypothetical protein